MCVLCFGVFRFVDDNLTRVLTLHLSRNQLLYCHYWLQFIYRSENFTFKYLNKCCIFISDVFPKLGYLTSWCGFPDRNYLKPGLGLNLIMKYN